MNKAKRLPLIAGAVLLVASFPLIGNAQDANSVSSPDDAYGSRPFAAYEDLLADFYTVADRVDMLRYHYTGKIIRLRLAGMLSAQETAIGIRADQKEAWRAYTQAMLALIPERDTVLSLIGVPDEDPKGPEAFGRAEALSDALSGYADKADALKKAISDLRGKLTPEQLEAAQMPRIVRG